MMQIDDEKDDGEQLLQDAENVKVKEDCTAGGKSVKFGPAVVLDADHVHALNI